MILINKGHRTNVRVRAFVLTIINKFLLLRNIFRSQ